MLSTKIRYAWQFNISNVRCVISHNVLPHTDSSANFLSSLKALNFTVSLSKTITEISCSSVSLLEINLSSRDVMLLLWSRSFRTFVGKTEGILFSDDIEQETWYSTGSCLHSTGHSNVTLARTITNHNQNTTTGVANSSDTNTTVSLDGMEICCNLQRERERERETHIECYRVCFEDMWNDSTKILCRVSVNCGYAPAVKYRIHAQCRTYIRLIL